MSDTNELIDIDLGPKEIHLVPASKGKRFANYVVDMIVFFTLFLILVIIGAFINVEWISKFEEINPLLDRLITAIILVIYYSILEFGLGGKTVGKYITKTRVVDLDGSKPSGNTFVLRSLSRIVPFEGLSFLGSRDDGWHDRWTDTMVIDEKLSTY